MSVKKIHHINFIVKDLDAAIAKYKVILGGGEFVKDELAGRGVITARVALGEQWIVLVQPTDENSVPGKYLAEHGEGFFLLSLEVGDMRAAVERVEAEGLVVTSESDRKGLLDWWVRDLSMDETFGAQMQFCEEREGKVSIS